MVRGVDHVAITVEAIDASLDRFVELGLEHVHDEVLERTSVRLAYLLPRDSEPGATALQLVEPLGPGPIQESLERNGPGLHHVCFTVDDIHETLAGLDDEVASIFMGGRGRLACFLSRTRAGALIELTEKSPRQLKAESALLTSSVLRGDDSPADLLGPAGVSSPEQPVD